MNFLWTDNQFTALWYNLLLIKANTLFSLKYYSKPSGANQPIRILINKLKPHNYYNCGWMTNHKNWYYFMCTAIYYSSFVFYHI